jgi:hypothetical protein
VDKDYKMSYLAYVYKVMIAGPNDVEGEKKFIRNIVQEWNNINSESNKIVLLPVGFETHSTPQMGERPQEIFNKDVLRDCDLLVAVFWTEIGSPTGKDISGTVEEIKEFTASKKPAMIYFSQKPITPKSIDDEQFQAVKEFEKECRNLGIIETFKSESDFKEKFMRQLAQKIIKDDCFSNSVIDTENLTDLSVHGETVNLKTDLSKEAHELLIEASQDGSGTVCKIHWTTGFVIQTNGKEFGDPSNPRCQASWLSAISELCNHGLFEESGNKGEYFYITTKGYRVADAIKLENEG